MEFLKRFKLTLFVDPDSAAVGLIASDDIKAAVAAGAPKAPEKPPEKAPEAPAAERSTPKDEPPVT